MDRFPYRSGDLQPGAPPETIVKRLPRGGHSTRDVVFSSDWGRMFVSVGSRSNAGERRIYAPWQSDEGRALVLAFTPEGNNKQLYATGLRNCVGMAVQPATGELWCSVNERDGLGDDLVPDFVTRVREGAFYGWPWSYIGGNENPRRVGEEPTLRQRVSVPDVLLQPILAKLRPEPVREPLPPPKVYVPPQEGAGPVGSTHVSLSRSTAQISEVIA